MLGERKAWGSILKGPMPLSHHRLMLGPSFHCKNNPFPPLVLLLGTYTKLCRCEFGSSWSFWQRFNNSALPLSPPPITSSHHRWWGRRRQRWLNWEDSIKKKGSSYIISSCVVLPPWPWVCVYTHTMGPVKKLLIVFWGVGVGGGRGGGKWQAYPEISKQNVEPKPRQAHSRGHIEGPRFTLQPIETVRFFLFVLGWVVAQ